MSLRSCTRQPEVAALLAAGHWPHACPPELRTHFDSCPTCAELLLVTSAFQQSKASAAVRAQLPAPGAIWWRAQLRRRNAAVERVAKPILGAYLFALIFTLIVAASLAIGHARQGFRWLDSHLADSHLPDALRQSPSLPTHSQAIGSSAWLSSSSGLGVLIPLLATVVLLGAVVVYLATERQ
jgi:hypothetical protein